MRYWALVLAVTISGMWGLTKYGEKLEEIDVLRMRLDFATARAGICTDTLREAAAVNDACIAAVVQCQKSVRDCL